MGYKCAPQITGLVRGEPKPGAKHRASGEAIAKEAGNERYSRSETLDRTRSCLNEYSGFCSGGMCWSAMEKQAEEYRMEVKQKNGSIATRGLRKDAVIGWALIFNPPAEMTIGWSKDDYDKFYADSFDVMEAIEPRLFRRENIRMTARHRDEGYENENGEYGEHIHNIGDAIDSEGRYCGNLVDARLCVRINENYPCMMREKGWDLDDLDRTDFSRMGKNENGIYKDPEYRAERIAKKKSSGRSVNKYVADITKEKLTAANDYLNDAQATTQELLETAEQLESDREALEALRADLEYQKARIQVEREKADREAQRALDVERNLRAKKKMIYSQRLEIIKARVSCIISGFTSMQSMRDNKELQEKLTAKKSELQERENVIAEREEKISIKEATLTEIGRRNYERMQQEEAKRRRDALDRALGDLVADISDKDDDYQL